VYVGVEEGEGQQLEDGVAQRLGVAVVRVGVCDEGDEGVGSLCESVVFAQGAHSVSQRCGSLVGVC